MKYAAIYVRVSTSEQKEHGLSVDNQIDSLVKYCDDRKMPYRIYNDAGISAHATYKKRPALLKLIDDCRDGIISIILFTRLDRWFRSVKDYYFVSEQLSGVPWRAIWEDYETETSSGQLKVNIMLSISEAEASRTSEKVKSVLDYKRETGNFVGKAATGYKIAHIDGKTTLVKDENTREMVEMLFREFLLNCSVFETTRKLQESGYKVSFANVTRIVTNPTYTGKKNNLEYEPYISEEDHAEILRQRKIRHRAPKNPKSTYVYSGLLVCGICGSKLSVYSSEKLRGRINYRCIHLCRKDNYAEKIPYIRIYEKDVDEFVLSQIDVEIANAKQKLETQIGLLSNDNKKIISSITDKIERLKDLYIDGEISKEDYRERKQELESRLKEYDSRVTVNVPDLPENWKDVYSSLSKEGQKSFMRKIIDRIEINAGEMHDTSRFKLFLR